MIWAFQSTVYVVMGQGLEMSVSHVFSDGAHFSEQINSDNLPYNIQNMDGKLSTKIEGEYGGGIEWDLRLGVRVQHLVQSLHKLECNTLYNNVTKKWS